jgi:hypothetical protein
MSLDDRCGSNAGLGHYVENSVMNSSGVKKLIRQGDQLFKGK